MFESKCRLNLGDYEKEHLYGTEYCILNRFSCTIKLCAVVIGESELCGVQIRESELCGVQIGQSVSGVTSWRCFCIC